LGVAAQKVNQNLPNSGVAKEVGDDQVKIWRRSFDVPPPPLAVTDARSPVKDPRYADLDPRVIPASESLKDVIARVGPYWTDQLRPAIKPEFGRIW
jgi:2,3-bisphosphoglycerate-dependent phosphoglycerate mutase